MDPSGYAPFTTKHSDGSYGFIEDTKDWNTFITVCGYVPFGSDIMQWSVNKITGLETISKDNIASVLNKSSTLLDVLSFSDRLNKVKRLPDSVKRKGNFVSKWASRVSAVITTIDVVAEIFSNSAAINQITDKMYHNEMTSATREGLIAKYIIYSELVNELVGNGSISYQTKFGNVTDINIDWNKVNKTKLDLKFDDDLVQKLFK